MEKDERIAHSQVRMLGRFSKYNLTAMTLEHLKLTQKISYMQVNHEKLNYTY